MNSRYTFFPLCVTYLWFQIVDVFLCCKALEFSLPDCDKKLKVCVFVLYEISVSFLCCVLTLEFVQCKSIQGKKKRMSSLPLLCVMPIFIEHQKRKCVCFAVYSSMFLFPL